MNEEKVKAKIHLADQAILLAGKTK